MYRISELAALVGLSRTTLLYYEKKGLIRGKRLENGYRIYSDRDAQRLKLILQLQAGGLTLKECQACLDARIDRSLLENRLNILDEEIAQKQASRNLLAALLGEGDTKAWHTEAGKQAPDAHLEWLVKQGFNEKEALRLKWLSKNMNEHEQYMTDFMAIFNALDRWGPGSETDTLNALSKVGFSPKTILEIGCGRGIATTLLATNCDADITALDNEESALDRLRERAKEARVEDKIHTLCASMTEMPFAKESFDVIWSEGSAYVMGVEKAFKQWRPLLKPGGVLVMSDLAWFTESPNEEANAFWAQEYPDISTVETRLAQAKACGFEVLDSFSLSNDAWLAYINPLKARIEALRKQGQDNAAMQDIERELGIYHQYLGEFGYQFYILKKM